MESAVKILEFCELLGKLKHLKRTGWVRKGVQEPETVACHMYRMAVLASLLDPATVSIDKCMKMALVHDMAESIVGDITPHCGVSNEAKFQLEKDGMATISSLLPSQIGSEFESLWEEYESQQTPESKAVKDLDKFDMIMQAFEYEKSQKGADGLEEFFKSTEGIFANEKVKEWVAALKLKRNSFKFE